MIMNKTCSFWFKADKAIICSFTKIKVSPTCLKPTSRNLDREYDSITYLNSVTSNLHLIQLTVHSMSSKSY